MTPSKPSDDWARNDTGLPLDDAAFTSMRISSASRAASPFLSPRATSSCMRSGSSSQDMRASAHKRFMLLATIALLPPALGRLRVLNEVWPQGFFGVTVIFIAAVVAYDYWTRRHVHAVSLWGGLFLALSFPGRIALGHTDAWLTFARWLVR